MNELILFSVSTIPVIILGTYIYKKDKNKEPAILLLKLFLGGILSTFLVFLISGILSIFFPILYADTSTLNTLQLLIYVFVGVALVEECSKWLFTYLIAYNDINFDEIYDMIVYSVFVALGFAFFENLLYVYEHGILTGLIRAISAVPGHACDGIFMGYYLALAKQSEINGRKDLKIRHIISSLLVPIILHGIYDYCLFTNNDLFIIVFFIFVVLLYIYAMKKVKKLSAIHKKMKYIDNFCPNCGTKVDSNFCPKCGRENN